MLTKLKAQRALSDHHRIPLKSSPTIHELQVKQKQCWNRLKEYYKSSPKFRAILLYSGFAAYIILGSLLFFAIEKTTTPPYTLDPRMYGTYVTCLGEKPYWGSLLYALSAASTIAFGQLRVCTHASRVITLFYSIFGIPLIVYILADLGGRLCYLLVHLYAFCRKLTICICKAARKRLHRTKPYHPCDDLPYIDASDVSTLTQIRSAKDRFLSTYLRIFRRHSGCGSGKSEQHSLEDIPSITVDLPDCKLNEIALDGNIPNNVEAGAKEKDDAAMNPQKVRIAEADTSSEAIDVIEEDPKSEKEEVDFGEFTPDLPLSICFLLIVLLIISITIHIHDFEYVDYGYSLYYAMLFFVLQDYEIRDIKNTIPTFIILLSGLAIVSTTINAVIYNIQNLTNRVMAKLPEEIRKRKEAMAAAGFPDAVIDPEEVLQEMLAKEGSFLTRSAMPKSTMENLGTFCETTVEDVEQKIKEERELENPTPLTIDFGVSMVPETATKGTSTIVAELVDEITQYALQSLEEPTNTDPKTFDDSEVQVTDDREYHDTSCQALVSLLDKRVSTDGTGRRDSFTQSIDRRTYEDAATQWFLDIKNAQTNTDLIRCLDRIVQCAAVLVNRDTNTTSKELRHKPVSAVAETANAEVDCVPRTKCTDVEAKPETKSVKCEVTVQDLKAAFGPKPVKATAPAEARNIAADDIGRLSQARLAQGTIRRIRASTPQPEDR